MSATPRAGTPAVGEARVTRSSAKKNGTAIQNGLATPESTPEPQKKAGKEEQPAEQSQPKSKSKAESEKGSAPTQEQRAMIARVMACEKTDYRKILGVDEVYEDKKLQAETIDNNFVKIATLVNSRYVEAEEAPECFKRVLEAGKRMNIDDDRISKIESWDGKENIEVLKLTREGKSAADGEDIDMEDSSPAEEGGANPSVGTTQGGAEEVKEDPPIVKIEAGAEEAKGKPPIAAIEAGAPVPNKKKGRKTTRQPGCAFDNGRLKNIVGCQAVPGGHRLLLAEEGDNGFMKYELVPASTYGRGYSESYMKQPGAKVLTLGKFEDLEDGSLDTISIFGVATLRRDASKESARGAIAIAEAGFGDDPEKNSKWYARSILGRKFGQKPIDEELNAYRADAGQELLPFRTGRVKKESKQDIDGVEV